MSTQITTAFVQQFRSNVMHLVQQKGSRLIGTTLEEQIVGEKAYWEQIGPVDMVERTTRHADTPIADTPHDRRMCIFKDYERGDLIDKQDRLRLLIEPENAYAIAFARAAGRQRDKVIIDAATGTAFAGKDGTTAVSFPAGQQVAVDYVESGATANSNLTVAKVRRANEILNTNEADEEDRWAVISSSGLRSLQMDDEFTSRDYNVIMPLMEGRIPAVSWMGFNWRRTELLNKSGDIRSALFYHREGIKLGVGQEMQVRMDERPDKSYATQVYICGSWGAVRLQEELVVEVLCDETA